MAAFLQGSKKLLWPSSLLSKMLARSVYDKKEGIPPDFISWLQQDLSLPGIRQRIRVTNWQLERKDQEYRADRHKILGPDLATAHFIVKRKGAVKFVDRDSWFRLEKNGKYYLPNRKIDGMVLEAVDASGTNLMSAGIENFDDLKSLRYLNVSNCAYVDDWCLAKFYKFSDTLEFLDISDCPQITERGVACLHHLKKLQGLKMKNLPKVENLELVILMLEELLPDCRIFGFDKLHDGLQSAESSEENTQEFDTEQSESQQRTRAQR